MTSAHTFRAATEDEIHAIDRPKRGSQKWPFRGMVVGDAVAIDDARHHTKARSAAQQAGLYKGWKFKTETTPSGVLIITRIE